MNESANDIINPSLVLAISRMVENNTMENQHKMVMEAMKAKFILPCKMFLKPGTEDEVHRHTGNTYPRFDLIKLENEETYFPAFTDTAELIRWKNVPNQDMMVIEFEDLAGLVLHAQDKVSGFIINPSTSHVFFKKEIIAMILKSMEEGRNPEKSQAPEDTQDTGEA